MLFLPPQLHGGNISSISFLDAFFLNCRNLHFYGQTRISLISIVSTKQTRRDDLGEKKCGGTRGGVYTPKCLLQGRPRAPRLRSCPVRSHEGRGSACGTSFRRVAGRPRWRTHPFIVQSDMKGLVRAFCSRAECWPMGLTSEWPGSWAQHTGDPPSTQIRRSLF